MLLGGLARPLGSRRTVAARVGGNSFASLKRIVVTECSNVGRLGEGTHLHVTKRKTRTCVILRAAVGLFTHQNLAPRTNCKHATILQSHDHVRLTMYEAAHRHGT